MLANLEPLQEKVEKRKIKIKIKIKALLLTVQL
jgi:hypothetical protein